MDLANATSRMESSLICRLIDQDHAYALKDTGWPSSAVKPVKSSFLDVRVATVQVRTQWSDFTAAQTSRRKVQVLASFILIAVIAPMKLSKFVQTRQLSSHQNAAPVRKSGRAAADAAALELAVNPAQSLTFLTSATFKTRAVHAGAGWVGAFGVVAILNVSSIGINPSLGLSMTYLASDDSRLN